MYDPLRRIRRLTLLLVFSGALNIILFALFFYWNAKEHLPTAYCGLRPANLQEQQSPLATDHCNSEVIRFFRKMSLEGLVSRLKNTQLVENGYAQRDLALACLVAFHHFDLERAVGALSFPAQKRTIAYGKFRNGKSAELTVYPGLSEKHYEAILDFASTERWPLTSKGLFLMLKKQKEQDPTLADAFFMTADFLAVETLFSRSSVIPSRDELLKMLLQGDWSMLSTFADQQKHFQDLSAARRQRFLLDYVCQQSREAAYLMLKADPNIAAYKLDDNHVSLLLDLLDCKSLEAEQFALALLTSPRSDSVWKKAAARLYEYAGEAIPEKYQHHAALSRFVLQQTMVDMPNQPQAPVLTSAEAPLSTMLPPIKTALPKLTPAPKPQSTLAKAETLPRKPVLTPASKKERCYVVQEGDSLWKISRRFDVDVDRLRAHNKLNSDALHPGFSMRIP
jgi:LysM repeat protein